MLVLTAGERKYEISNDGLTVYNPTLEDGGQYECIGAEVTSGKTKTVVIQVEVVSKLSVILFFTAFADQYPCRSDHFYIA